jgi:hypothetical protein
MPMFLLLRWPVHEGLGCAQAIQVWGSVALSLCTAAHPLYTRIA